GRHERPAVRPTLTQLPSRLPRYPALPTRLGQSVMVFGAVRCRVAFLAGRVGPPGYGCAPHGSRALRVASTTAGRRRPPLSREPPRSVKRQAPGQATACPADG